jgi:nitronate monooxygenase
MFLVSGPELVIGACQSGVLGTFPALNQRSSEGYADWLDQIAATLQPGDAPFGVNLIVHKSNPRLAADVKISADKKIPLAITSLGAVKDVVQAIQGGGGLVFHDVTSLKHAEKATAAGVDGLVAVCAGAGGHAGTLSPFALIGELRAAFPDTCLVLAGAISSGHHVASARVMGADLVYMGTRFNATHESRGQEGFKKMLADSQASDIVYTPRVSGIPANFLAPSLRANGLDPADLQPDEDVDLAEQLTTGKAWATLWSAGQGVGSIHDILPVKALVDRLESEYRSALNQAQDY